MDGFITFLSEHANVFAAFVGVPGVLLAWWRALQQRDDEVRAPYRKKVLDAAFELSRSIGEFINSPDANSYNANWQKVAQAYSGVGQLIGDEKLYAAFN